MKIRAAHWNFSFIQKNEMKEGLRVPFHLAKRVGFFCCTFVFVFFSGTSLIFSQSRHLDSMLRVLNTTKNDTEWVKTSNRISRQYGFAGDTTNAFAYADRAMKRAEKINFLKGVGAAYSNKATALEATGNYVRALENYSLSLEIFKKTKDTVRIASVLGNTGIIYFDLADWSKAINQYLLALKLFQIKKDKEGICNTLNSIGNVFLKTGETKSALNYFKESLALAQHSNLDQQAGTALANIGILFIEEKKYDSALTFFREALRIKTKTGVISNAAILYTNIGNVWFYINNQDSALFYYHRSFALRKKLNDFKGMSLTGTFIAETYFRTGDINKSLEYARLALRNAQYSNANEQIKNACGVLARAFAQKKQFDSAYIYTNRWANLKDEIMSSEKKEEIARKEMKYFSDQKENELKDKNKLNEVALQKQQIISYASIGGGILVLGLLLLSFKAYRTKRKANKEIEAKRKELETQHAIIEEKQKEILDSIQYAKRIQQSLITSEKYIERKLNEMTK